jgi:hypothetical protein
MLDYERASTVEDHQPTLAHKLLDRSPDGISADAVRVGPTQACPVAMHSIQVPTAAARHAAPCTPKEDALDTRASPTASAGLLGG